MSAQVMMGYDDSGPNSQGITLVASTKFFKFPVCV